VTVLVANLDSTVLNVTLPTLVRDLNATPGDLQWIVDSYIVVFAGSLLAAGSLADRIGRKKTLLAGLAVFAGGSAWAAFSGDVGTLIAARASMGIGGALMIPSTLSIISNMFRDPAERQRAIGRWGATSGIGVALGPIIGGFLLARFWWGSVFLINVPIAMVGLLAAHWLVPDSKNPVAKAPDLTGAALSMAGIGVILWSIIEGPTRGWASPLVIGAAAGGLAVLALFVVWERITVHPMLDLSFFRQRPFSAAIPAVVTLTFGLFGALFVLTQFLQLALGFTALQAGIRLLPVAAAVIVVAPVSAVGVRAIGPKFTIAAGLALVATGLWLISGAAVSTAFTGLAAGMVLLGAGAGLALPTATGSVVGSVPPTESGVASAADTTAIQLGGALGVAVVGSLLATRYQDRMTGALSGRPFPATVKSSLSGALAAARADGTTGPPLIHLAKTAFISGMDLGLLTGAVVAVAGCLVALICLPARSGRKDQLNRNGPWFPAPVSSQHSRPSPPPGPCPASTSAPTWKPLTGTGRPGCSPDSLVLGTWLSRSWRSAEGKGRRGGCPGRAMVDAKLVRYLACHPQTMAMLTAPRCRPGGLLIPGPGRAVVADLAVQEPGVGPQSQLPAACAVPNRVGGELMRGEHDVVDP
jgi:EmrB/QacA subfamily drug resistance transporter